MARATRSRLSVGFALLLAAAPLALAANTWPQYGWSEQLDLNTIPRAVKNPPADKKPQLRALALSNDGKKVLWTGDVWVSASAEDQGNGQPEFWRTHASIFTRRNASYPDASWTWATTLQADWNEQYGMTSPVSLEGAVMDPRSLKFALLQVGGDVNRAGLAFYPGASDPGSHDNAPVDVWRNSNLYLQWLDHKPFHVLGLFYVGTVAPSAVPILGAVAAIYGHKSSEWEYQVWTISANDGEVLVNRRLSALPQAGVTAATLGRTWAISQVGSTIVTVTGNPGEITVYYPYTDTFLTVKLPSAWSRVSDIGALTLSRYGTRLLVLHKRELLVYQIPKGKLLARLDAGDCAAPADEHDADPLLLTSDEDTPTYALCLSNLQKEKDAATAKSVIPYDITAWDLKSKTGLGSTYPPATSWVGFVQRRPDAGGKQAVALSANGKLLAFEIGYVQADGSVDSVIEYWRMA